MGNKANAAAAAADTTERTFTKVGLRDANSAGLRFIRPKQLADDGILGVVAQGIYIGTTPNTFEPSRMDYKLTEDDGGTVILNANGSLTKQMSKVAEGSYVRISYSGMKKIESGKLKGKSVHNFTVEVAE